MGAAAALLASSRLSRRRRLRSECPPPPAARADVGQAASDGCGDARGDWHAEDMAGNLHCRGQSAPCPVAAEPARQAAAAAEGLREVTEMETLDGSNAEDADFQVDAVGVCR
jgi:hypothetical protein